MGNIFRDPFKPLRASVEGGVQDIFHAAKRASESSAVKAYKMLAKTYNLSQVSKIASQDSGRDFAKKGQGKVYDQTMHQHNISTPGLRNGRS